MAHALDRCWDVKGSLGEACKCLCIETLIEKSIITDPNSIRTMTLWSSKEEVEANLDKIRAAAGSDVGV